MARLKSKKAKSCREKIHTYIKKTYINEDPEWNSGQLKFFKGLLVGNLAVAINKKLKKDTAFLKYLDDNILKPNDDVISFFDEQENWNAFLNSPYCPAAEPYRGKPSFNPAFKCPPYLPVKKSQAVMEREFISYILLSGEKEQKKDEKNTPKATAYVALLFSIAIYEMSLYEYGRRLPDLSLPEYTDSASKYITEQKTERRQNILELLDRLTSDYDQMQNAYLVFCYWNSYIMHTINLYAMLRLVAIVEYVKIHSREKNADAAQVEAEFWITLQKKLNKSQNKCYLFTCSDINHNLKVYARKFSSIYQTYKISAYIQPQESSRKIVEQFHGYEDVMFQYIDILKQRHANRNDASEQLEEDLWDAAIRFANPVLSAVNAINDLRQDDQ